MILGQRTKKTLYQADGITVDSTTIYHYDQSGMLITETTEAGTLIKDYIWNNMHPVAQIDAVIPAKDIPEKAGTEIQSIKTMIYLYTDHLMTNRLATDSNGFITWQWEGEAFGNTPTQELAGVSVNLRFPRQYYDNEINLYYNMMRYYDPALSRYITIDPIGLQGGLSTYLYVNANPLNRIDPNGLFDIDLAESISAGISGVFPVSPSGLGTGGTFGVTLRKCCTDQNTIANELFISGGFGPGAGGVISLSSAPSGNIGVAGTGGLPECLYPTVFWVDLGPSATFKGGAGFGPSVGVSRDGVVVGAGIQAGAGILALPQEAALVIFQTDTGQPCDCE